MLDTAANINAVSVEFLKTLDQNYLLPKSDGFVRGFNGTLTKSLGCVDLSPLS